MSKDFYKSYNINRKDKLPYVTGKIAVSKNNLIYSNLNKKITNEYSDKFTHLLRYKNDSILITYKTLNKDNPKLNCRLKGLESFSPKKIILDNKLNSKPNKFIITNAKKNNTIIFYNQANKSKILSFKKKKILLIKSRLDKSKNFIFRDILKKLFKIGCRSLLIEGGGALTNNLLKKRVFNEFYLYKGQRTLSKFSDYLKFNDFDLLREKYKKKINLNLKLGKDKITLFKK